MVSSSQYRKGEMSSLLVLTQQSSPENDAFIIYSATNVHFYTCVGSVKMPGFIYSSEKRENVHIECV